MNLKNHAYGVHTLVKESMEVEAMKKEADATQYQAETEWMKETVTLSEHSQSSGCHGFQVGV